MAAPPSQYVESDQRTRFHWVSRRGRHAPSRLRKEAVADDDDGSSDSGIASPQDDLPSASPHTVAGHKQHPHPAIPVTVKALTRIDMSITLSDADLDRLAKVSRPGDLPIRRLSVAVLDSLVQKRALEADWRRKPHTHLDLSDAALFKLGVFQPLDFVWGKREPKDADEFPVWQLQALNLDNNELTDILFAAEWADTKSLTKTLFVNLDVLSLRSNALVCPKLSFPRLRELNLSSNGITQMPPLLELPCLQVLDLSCNRIATLEKGAFRYGKNRTQRLRTLNLKSNALELLPSELRNVLLAMAKGTEMSQLRLHRNPFCAYFSEYQPLVIRCLPLLTHLDDLSLTKGDCHLRADMLEAANVYFGYEFRRLDDESRRPVRSVTDLTLDQVNAYLATVGVQPVRSYDEAHKYSLENNIALLDKDVKLRRAVCLSNGKTPQMPFQQQRPQHGSTTATSWRALGEIPKLTGLVRELDEAIAGFSAVATSVSLVFDLVSPVSSASMDRLATMFDDNHRGRDRAAGSSGEHQNESSAARAAKEETVVTFVQQVEMIYERNPSSRLLLIRILAKLSAIPFYRMGELCLTSLGAFAKANSDGMHEVLRVLKELVLPQIAGKHISDPSCATIVVGLGRLGISELATVLGPVVPQLIVFAKALLCQGSALGVYGQGAREREGVASLLHCAVGNRDSAMQINIDQDKLCAMLAQSLLGGGLFLDDFAYNLYLNIVGTLRCCLRHFPDETIRNIRNGKDVDTQLHLGLVEMLGSVIVDGPLDELSLAQCKKAGAAMELVTDMMRDEGVFVELGAAAATEGFSRLVNIIIAVTTSDSADPVLLAATLNCLCTLLEREAMESVRDAYFKIFSQELALTGENRILPYIDERKFKGLYQKCELHLVQKEKELEDSAYLVITSAVPEFKTCTNSFAHSAIIAVIRFLNLFSIMAPKDKMCARISNQLNSLGWEHTLFRLLEVPSSKVQEAVVRAIGTTEISELDDSQMEKLVCFLDPTKIDQHEQLLKYVLLRLQNLLAARGAAADGFRSKHGRNVLKRTFGVLRRNAARPTYDNLAEEAQKVGLSTGAVQLLATASQQPSLRAQLREPDIVGEISGVLKDEELHVAWQREDVCVELTWTGRSVEYLLGSIGGKGAVDSSRKQGFRVLARIADVVAGVADPINAPPSAALDRGRREAKMWKNRQLRWETGFLDDSVYEDRIVQQQSFVAFSGLERCTNFLERRVAEGGLAGAPQPGAWPSIADRNSASAATNAMLAKAVKMVDHAREFVRHLKQYALDRAVEIETTTKEKKTREKATEIFLGDGYVATTVKGPELLCEVLMREGWKSKEDLGCASASSAGIPEILRAKDVFFVPGSAGIVDKAFPLAALLRAVYALLLVPGVERFREEIVAHLREPGMLVRLVALVEQCDSFVDCHVAAKLLRVMSHALQMSPGHAVVEGEQYIVSLLFAAAFAGRCLLLVAPLLATSCGTFVLTVQQQTLCIEAVRLLRSISSALCRVRGSAEPEVQAECVKELLGFALPMHTMHCVFLCMLYDMQVGIGSLHGTSITDKYVQSTLERQGLRELCTGVLSSMLDACPQFRYDILEMFSRYEVIGKHHVRESFLHELMENVRMHKYRAALENMLQEKHSLDERILFCASIDWLTKGKKDQRMSVPDHSPSTEHPPRTLVLSSHWLYVTERPRHGTLAKRCGVCPPESFCPVAPSIEKRFRYTDLTRIVTGPDPQSFMLGWPKRTASDDDVRRMVTAPDPQSFMSGWPKRTTSDEVAGERFDVFVLHKGEQRRAILEALRALSGPSVNSQVEVTQDEVVIQAVGFHTKSNRPPICLTHAVRQLADGGKRMSLFVLLPTEEFFEFEVNFEHWVVPVNDILDIGEDDDLDLHGDPDDPTSAALFEDSLARARQARRARRTYQTKAQEWLHGPSASAATASVSPTRMVEAPSDVPGVASAAAPPPPPQPSSAPRPPKSTRDARSKERVRSEEDVIVARERAKLYTSQIANANGGDGSAARSSQVAAAAALKKAQAAIIRPLLRGSLADLTGVDFEHGEDPIMRLSFSRIVSGSGGAAGEEVEIRFLCDVARERWRRGLAFVLNRSDAGVQWHRSWTGAHGDPLDPEAS